MCEDIGVTYSNFLQQNFRSHFPTQFWLIISLIILKPKFPDYFNNQIPWKL